MVWHDALVELVLFEVPKGCGVGGERRQQGLEPGTPPVRAGIKASCNPPVAGDVSASDAGANQGTQVPYT